MRNFILFIKSQENEAGTKLVLLYQSRNMVWTEIFKQNV